MASVACAVSVVHYQVASGGPESHFCFVRFTCFLPRNYSHDLAALAKRFAWRFQSTSIVDCDGLGIVMRRGMKMRRWSMPVSVVLCAGFLAACESVVVLGTLAVSPALAEHQTAKQRQTDEYLANVFERRTPIIPRTVNHPIDSNGLCLLELAISRARVDIMQDALDVGADPLKCRRDAGPLIFGLRYLKQKDMSLVREVLRGAAFMKTYDKSAFVAEGIMVSNPALVQMGLDFGVRINDPITAPAIYLRQAPAASTPLNLAVQQYAHWNSESAEVLKLVISSGAKYEESIDELLLEKKRRKMPTDELVRILEVMKR